MFTKIKLAKEVYSRLFQLSKKGYTNADIEKISLEITKAINNEVNTKISYEEAIKILDKEFEKY